MHRRDFLRAGGVTILGPTLAGLLAACGKDGTPSTAATAGTSPSSSTARSSVAPRKVKLGFIALTDCASIVMAKELGYFTELDLDVTIEKQASWPATRDNLLNNGLDGAHCLASMPFSLATGIGGQGTALKIAMILNNNGQAITLNKDFASVGYRDLAKAKAALESREPTLAMTFPGGHPRHVAPVLAQGHGCRHVEGQDHPHPAAPDGGQREGRGHGRVLRGRAVECRCHPLRGSRSCW